MKVVAVNGHPRAAREGRGPAKMGNSSFDMLYVMIYTKIEYKLTGHHSEKLEVIETSGVRFKNSQVAVDQI